MFRRRALGCLLTLVLVVCVVAPVTAERLAVPAGWAVRHGTGGLVCLTPRDWRLQSGSGGRFVIYHPAGGGAVDGLLAVEPLARVNQTAQALVAGVERIWPRLFPGARVSGVRLVSTQPQAAVAGFTYQSGGRQFKGSALGYINGGRGVVYAISAQSGVWPAFRPVMLKMLRSFFYTAGDGHGVAGAVRLPAMVRWQDPKEHAFTCLVPRGWSVEGGMVRLHAVDTRPELLVQSPDRRILIRLGDAAVPFFMQPNPLVPNGTWYHGPYGNQAFALYYLPGAEFLSRYYLPQRVGRVSRLRLTSLPRLAREAARRWSRAGLPQRVDVGEATFTTQGRQGPRRGYAFCTTAMIQVPGGANYTWRVPHLYGYLAAPGQEPLARALLSKMVASFQIDPSWQALQVATAGRNAQIVAQSNREITHMINQEFVQRQATLDRIFERWARYNRGW